MTEPPDDLERELRQLRPAPLPAPLAERLLAARQAAAADAAVAIEQPIRSGRSVTWLTLGAFAAAIVFTAGAFLHARRELPTPGRGATDSGLPMQAAQPDSAPQVAATPKDAPASRFHPTGWTNTLLSAADEGLVRNDARGPARRIRYEAVETFTFRDPKTGATIEIDVPREEVVLVPIDPI